MLFPKLFQPEVIEKFVRLIAKTIGFQIRERDRESLCQKIQARMKNLGISFPDGYYQLLTQKNYTSNREWQELARLLTNTESYFFRDKGQFSLLRYKILPDLIAKKRQTGDLSLRLWSAGCSTGEEPYSLAILLQEQIPDWHQWNFEIIGTDVNLTALENAQKGIFNAWSFRLVEPEIQRQFFHPLSGDRWQLNSLSRSWVRFEYGNLVNDSFPNSSVYEMDLIICRNVFVYFDFSAISIVLNKFFGSLRVGGYLITGHAELSGQAVSQFEVQVFPESVVYKRPEKASFPLKASTVSFTSQRLPALSQVPLTRQPTQNLVTANQTVSKTNRKLQQSNRVEVNKVEGLLEEVHQLFKQKNYKQAIQKAQQVLTLADRNFEALCLLGQLYGNLGEYAQAKECCDRAISVNSLAIEPYFLLGKIAEEQGEIEVAKGFYKKVIYLAPNTIPAYLELSYIYEVEGDSNKAKKMLMTTLELLKEAPLGSSVDYRGKVATDALFTQVRERLKNKYFYEDA